MPLTHLLLALLVVLFWGVNVVAIKLAVSELPPLFASGLRYVLVGCLLLPFLKWLPGRMVQVFALTLMFGVLHFGLLFVGMSGVDASLASILIQLSVPFGLLLGWWLLGEAFGWSRSAALLVALVGVVVVFGGPETASSRWHIVTIMGAVFCWALANIQIKALSDVSVLTLQAWMGAVSGPCLLALGWAIEKPDMAMLHSVSWMGWVALAYTAIGGSIAGHSLWYWLVARNNLANLLPVLLLQPLVGILAAIVILQESLDGRTLGGGALILLGVAVIQLRGAQSTQPPAEKRPTDSTT